jgi:branched-chain amino acid transport system permease protein
MAHPAQDGVGDTPHESDLTASGGPGSTIPEAETGPAPGRSAWDAKRVALTAVAIVAIAFIFFKAVEDPKRFVVVTLNGTTLAALYFVVASGFTLIFGLMRVVNMAHGSLYLLGGYLCLEMQNKWFIDKPKGGGGFTLGIGGAEDEATIGLLGWIIPLLLATAIIGIIGVVIQQVFLRWNQGQDLRQALITIALSVIIADQMLAAYGGISKDIKTPTDWPTSITLPADIRFGFFRGVIVLGAALLIAFGLWYIIKRTRFGKIVRAGVDDRDMVSALGINVQLIFAFAFLLGALLAGFGGVLGGTMISLAPGQDTAFLLNSLIVVIIGGMGSLGGAAIGALALGLVDAYADVYLTFGDTDLTNYSILVTFALLVAVLAVRPLGLFGRPA